MAVYGEEEDCSRRPVIVLADDPCAGFLEKLPVSHCMLGGILSFHNSQELLTTAVLPLIEANGKLWDPVVTISILHPGRSAERALYIRLHGESQTPVVGLIPVGPAKSADYAFFVMFCLRSFCAVHPSRCVMKVFWSPELQERAGMPSITFGREAIRHSPPVLASVFVCPTASRLLVGALQLLAVSGTTNIPTLVFREEGEFWSWMAKRKRAAKVQDDDFENENSPHFSRLRKYLNEWPCAELEPENITETFCRVWGVCGPLAEQSESLPLSHGSSSSRMKNRVANMKEGEFLRSYSGENIEKRANVWASASPLHGTRLKPEGLEPAFTSQAKTFSPLSKICESANTNG